MRSATHHEHQTQPVLDRPPDPPSILLEPFFRIGRLVLDHDVPDERVDRRTSRGLGHGFEGRVVGFRPEDETAYRLGTGSVWDGEFRAEVSGQARLDDSLSCEMDTWSSIVESDEARAIIRNYDSDGSEFDMIET
jgi:hypothetical protein